ncbi:mitogen-activated protein kinase 3, partial [Tanacetum coccineum]
IDVWSVGCIYMELMNRKPLFPGKDHVHQMRLLTELLGTPTKADLGFIKNKDAMTCLSQLPRHPRKALLKTFPHVNQSAIDLVEKMLTFDPDKRITGI